MDNFYCNRNAELSLTFNIWAKSKGTIIEILGGKPLDPIKLIFGPGPMNSICGIEW